MAMRSRLIYEMIESYSPDILALQEFNNIVRNSRDGMLVLIKIAGYTEVQITHPVSGAVNQTPLFYNPKTLKIVDKGYDFFEGSWNNGNSKGATWALFEHIDSGEKFIAISTHFYYQSDAGSGRVENAKDIVSRVIALDSKYSCPIFVGGDLNTKYSTAPITVLRSAGLRHAYDLAAFKENKGTHHAYPIYTEEYGYLNVLASPVLDFKDGIDHSMVYNYDGWEIKNYYVDTTDFGLMSSDHCPMIVDIKIKK